MPVVREDLASDDRAGGKLHLPKSGKRGRRWESHRRIVHGSLCKIHFAGEVDVARWRG
jgi:hypothetical protein